VDGSGQQVTVVPRHFHVRPQPTSDVSQRKVSCVPLAKLPVEQAMRSRSRGLKGKYMSDADFGPGFIKICTFFPANVQVISSKARRVNQRLLVIERAGQGCAIGSALVSASTSPTRGRANEPGLPLRGPTRQSPGRLALPGRLRRSPRAPGRAVAFLGPGRKGDISDDGRWQSG
jgi:hypothetical protein